MRERGTTCYLRRAKKGQLPTAADNGQKTPATDSDQVGSQAAPPATDLAPLIKTKRKRNRLFQIGVKVISEE